MTSKLRSSSLRVVKNLHYHEYVFTEGQEQGPSVAPPLVFGIQGVRRDGELVGDEGFSIPSCWGVEFCFGFRIERTA